MDPNDVQVGGNHYREIPGEQHWDRIWRKYGRGYFVGQITKYVERYHLKNGVQDLEKARHFLDKLISLELKKEPLKDRFEYVRWDGKMWFHVYRCRKCGAEVKVTKHEFLEQAHGECAGRDYVRQD